MILGINPANSLNTCRIGCCTKKFRNIQKTSSSSVASDPAVLSKKSYPSFGNYETHMHSFMDFDETIKHNFFKLPIINGVQAMPDKTQLAAAQSLYKGDSTICIAPTGTGKTAIANYIITKNLGKGKRTFYTTPLKALSNDKYREFCKIYGEENVGLLTGDIKLKKDAPVVIMTTEIFRNMVLSDYATPQKGRFKDTETVVFDEAHYINDDERGKIWEESVMLAPKNVQILALSATVGNAQEFSDWIGSITNRQTQLVESSPRDRYVPLVYYNYVSGNGTKLQELIRGKVDVVQIAKLNKESALSEKQERALLMLEEKSGCSREDLLLQLGKSAEGLPVKHNEFARMLQRQYAFKELQAQEVTQLLIDSDTRKINTDYLGSNIRTSGQSAKDYKVLINNLNDEGKLPAIIFKFSRKACNDSAKDVLDEGIDLTNEKEKEQIAQIIQQYQDDDVYLGRYFRKEQLLKGVASHNAGLMPGYKKLVEELFSRKLLKVVFATSTLSAGINMPAKTVVITQLTKPTHKEGMREEALSANEFHQMAGRAGRRGIDTIGNVVLYNLKSTDQGIAQNLILQKANPLISKYVPTYNMIASYYRQQNPSENLKRAMERTFMVHQAGTDKAKVLEKLQTDVKNREEVLKNLGLLVFDETQGSYTATAKGKMLTKVHGYNEIPLVNMIANGRLSDLNPVELTSFAAQIAGMGTDFSEDDENEIASLLYKKCMEIPREELMEAVTDALDYDKELKNAEAKYGLESEGNRMSVISAYVGYIWADANSHDKDPVKAFKSIINIGTRKQGSKSDRNPFKILYEGDIYQILSQSADVLKQIINVAEFVLEHPELGCDEHYYTNLIQTAQKSLELVKKPPIYDSLSIA